MSSCVGGFKFKPLFNFSKRISAPVFCDPICYTLKQLQNPLKNLLVAEKDTKNSLPPSLPIVGNKVI